MHTSQRRLGHHRKGKMHPDQFAVGDYGRHECAYGFHPTVGPIAYIVETSNAKSDEVTIDEHLLHRWLVRNTCCPFFLLGWLLNKKLVSAPSPSTASPNFMASPSMTPPGAMRIPPSGLSSRSASPSPVRAPLSTVRCSDGFSGSASPSPALKALLVRLRNQDCQSGRAEKVKEIRSKCRGSTRERNQVSRLEIARRG